MITAAPELVWLPDGSAYLMVWCDCPGEVHLHPLGIYVNGEDGLSWLPLEL